MYDFTAYQAPRPSQSFHVALRINSKLLRMAPADLSDLLSPSCSPCPGPSGLPSLYRHRKSVPDSESLSLTQRLCPGALCSTHSVPRPSWPPHSCQPGLTASAICSEAFLNSFSKTGTPNPHTAPHHHFY